MENRIDGGVKRERKWGGNLRGVSTSLQINTRVYMNLLNISTGAGTINLRE